MKWLAGFTSHFTFSPYCLDFCWTSKAFDQKPVLQAFIEFTSLENSRRLCHFRKRVISSVVLSSEGVEFTAEACMRESCSYILIHCTIFIYCKMKKIPTQFNKNKSSESNVACGQSESILCSVGKSNLKI